MIKAFILFVLYSIWEYWLGKTKKFIANSSIELLTWFLKTKIFRRKIEMEKDVKLGEKGDLDLKLEKGMATLTLSYGDPALGLSGKVEVQVKAEVLLDKIAAAIPGKIDDAVLGVVKAAVSQA